MPEYLAPGVYIEEIEIGAKPIEGVSTSTAGFLGYAERGPLNKPTLVTSLADFERKFGGFLPTTKNGKDISKIRWLAYAVSGFFENGGKRAYITRVASDDAAAAKGFLPKLSEEGAPPVLDSNVKAKDVELKLNEDIPTDWKEGDILLLKDGAQSEYLTFKGQGGTKKTSKISPALKYTHEKGKELIKLVPAVKVTASSEGTWGNSIKVAVKQSSLSTTKLTRGATDSDRLDLETITGIEPGSLLKLPTADTPQYVTVKETHKTSTDIFVILESAFTGTLKEGDKVQTEEFRLVVTDGKNVESFNNLSLNEKHSRYIKKIVTEKSSDLIRINDITGSPPTIPMPTPDDMPGWLLKDGDDGLPKGTIKDTDLNPIYEGKDNAEPAKRSGLHTFKNVDEINIVAIPGITTKYLQQKVIAHCEEMKDRFAVLDPQAKADLDEIKMQRNLFDTSYAALYYPWIYCFDPLSKEYINIPPSGHICGIYARSDVERGVHKAPANEKINGVVNLERLNGKFRIVNKGTQEILNPLGINCIRPFPGRGIRVWGARTVSSDPLWKYLNVRRLFLYLEESIEEGTQWVVFEPNNEKLWARVKQSVTQFLTRVWKDGALMGLTPEEAFFVKCDRTTMTQDDIDNGRLIVLIGVAPVKPAEFVIFRIAQWAGGSEVTE